MRILIHFSKCGDFLLTVPRLHNRGGQTIFGGMVGSTLKTCGGFLLTVPRSLGTAAEEDRRSWAGWLGQTPRTDDLGRDGRVDLEDLWWLSFNSPSAP